MDNYMNNYTLKKIVSNNIVKYLKRILQIFVFYIYSKLFYYKIREIERQEKTWIIFEKEKINKI